MKEPGYILGFIQTEDICAMDANPARVHQSLLAQVQDYVNCNLFPGQEARSSVLHCMQSKLVNVAGAFPGCARPVGGSGQPSLGVPGKQGVETADCSWKQAP